MCKEVQGAIRQQHTGGASEAGQARAQENAEIESYMRDLDDAIARMVLFCSHLLAFARVWLTFCSPLAHFFGSL